MDAGHIMVALLIVAAACWLIWAERNSRRNTDGRNATKPCGEGEYQPHRRSKE